MSRRHALVIGIDAYPNFGPEAQLAGAIRDAEAMTALLTEKYGFAAGDVLQRFGGKATRSGILKALEKLRRRVRNDDQVLLFYSGHGSQMTDREDDEGDGLDETLVPCDSGRTDEENRDITDDEINDWAARVLEMTPRVTLIFDCCHSATLHRPRWRVRSLPPDLRSADELPPSPVERDIETGPRPLIAAACRDDELAIELPFASTGEIRGAFSSHLIEAMRDASARTTWREIFGRISSAMAHDCPDQHPELSGAGLDLPIFGRARSGSQGIDTRDHLLNLAARPNRLGLTMKIFRSRGGAWKKVEKTLFVDGDRLRVDISHKHHREIFVYLLDIGLTGAVSLLFPDVDGHEALDSHSVLSVGARRGDALVFYMPGDLTPDVSEGVGHLILLGSQKRLSTARLLSVAFEITDSAVIGKSYRLSRQ